MNCPVCGGKVKVEYCVSDCEGVYRKRKCVVCNHTFYTTEYEGDKQRFKELYKEYRKSVIGREND